MKLEQILGKALARDAKKRYASARDFARDLEHPTSVVISGHFKAGQPIGNTVLFYSALAAIPATILLLLLFVAHNQ